MLLHSPPKDSLSILSFLGLLLAVTVAINPLSGLNFLFIAGYLLLIGQVFLKEKIFLLFIFIRPTIDFWRDVNIFTFKETSLNVNSALSIAFLLWAVFQVGKNYRLLPKAPLTYIFLGNALFMMLSSVWSVYKVTSLIESVKFVNLFLFFVLGYIFIKKKLITAKQLLLAIVLGAIIPIIFSLSQLVFGTGLDTFGVRGRLYGTLAHPNIFAFILLTLIILLTQYAIINPTIFWQKNLGLRDATFVFLISLLLLTYTRAAFIGLAIYLFILGILKYRKLLLIFGTGVLAFYILFYPVNSFLNSAFGFNLQKYSLIARLTARNDDADSIAWRQAVLQETFPLMQVRPILGYGYGTFPKVWSDNQGLNHLTDDSTEAHNDYLRLMLEDGVIGLALYLLLLAELSFVFGLRAQKEPKKFLHIFGWLIVFIVLSLSDNMLHHTPVMWLTAAYWGAMLAEPISSQKWSPNLLG